MTSRLQFGVLGVFMMALLALPLFPAEVDAQVGARFRVMVTNLQPAEGANDDFGKDLAKELRKLINELPTHQPVEEKEIKEGAKRYDMKMEDLDCIRSLQLATQINARLVMCGTYTEDKRAKTFALSGIQFAAPGGVTFAIEDKTWGEKQYREAAHEIYSSFGTYVEQLRVAQFCGDYYNSKTWDSAEELCTRAIELNPEDPQVRYIYARVLMDTERNEEAYEEAKRVIALDPLHEDALQVAGLLAAALGRPEEARGHFDSYLLLKPGNAAVRMTVAYDLAQAGDPEGAMLIDEEGLALEEDNVELRLQHAAFAVAAAGKRKEGVAAGEPLPPEAQALYEKALESYDVAYGVRGAEMEANHLRNMIAAYNEIGQVDEAVNMAERALQTHDQEAQLWSIYADVLKKADRLSDAVAALDNVVERDPEYRNVAARHGNWLLEAEREDEALPYLRAAVESGEQTADIMARLLLGAGHRRGISQKNWAYGIRLIEMAKTFDPAEAGAAELDFWHGYSLFQQALEQQKPQTVQTAQASLPKFQQAQRFFGLQRVAAYAETQPTVTLQQFRDATTQYIEIQEAIIQRGN